MASELTRNGRVIGYRRDDLEIDPPLLYPDYVSTRTRAPKRPLVPMPHTLSEITGPVYGDERIGELDHDLTRQHEGEPIGERIIVHGRVLDGDGRPVRNTLIEIWQANAGGRYRHHGDQHPAPLDPNFSGGGRDDDRRRGPLPSSSRSSPAPTRGTTTTTPGARGTSTSRCSDRRSRRGW